VVDEPRIAVERPSDPAEHCIAVTVDWIGVEQEGRVLADLL
jgi:hypothetical protein